MKVKLNGIYIIIYNYKEETRSSFSPGIPLPKINPTPAVPPVISQVSTLVRDSPYFLFTTKRWETT